MGWKAAARHLGLAFKALAQYEEPPGGCGAPVDDPVPPTPERVADGDAAAAEREAREYEAELAAHQSGAAEWVRSRPRYLPAVAAETDRLSAAASSGDARARTPVGAVLEGHHAEDRGAGGNGFCPVAAVLALPAAPRRIDTHSRISKGERAPPATTARYHRTHHLTRTPAPTPPVLRLQLGSGYKAPDKADLKAKASASGSGEASGILCPAHHLPQPTLLASNAPPPTTSNHFASSLTSIPSHRISAHHSSSRLTSVHLGVCPSSETFRRPFVDRSWTVPGTFL